MLQPRHTGKYIRAHLFSNFVLEKEIKWNDRVKSEEVCHGVKWEVQYTATMEG